MIFVLDPYIFYALSCNNRMSMRIQTVGVGKNFFTNKTSSECGINLKRS